MALSTRTRKAIAVTETNGYYEFMLGSDPVYYAGLREVVHALKVSESLMGWEPWQWAVETDNGTYFVTGDDEPEEFGLDADGNVPNFYA